MRYIIIIAIIIQFNISVISKTCNKCKCYKLECSRIKDQALSDIEQEPCQDEFKDSCEDKEDIVKENNCELECDCCLEGTCVKWNNYYCIMYRTFGCFAVFYFILISFNMFLIMKLYNYFFNLIDKLKLYNQSLKKDKVKLFTKEKIIIKYKGLFSINKIDEPAIHINKIKYSIINNLFINFEIYKKTSTKNIVQLSFIILVYLFSNIIHFYFIFVLYEKPYAYGKAAWVQHILLIFFYIIIYILYTKVNSYSSQIAEEIMQFEKINKCKIRVNKIQKYFEFSFEEANENSYKVKEFDLKNKKIKGV